MIIFYRFFTTKIQKKYPRINLSLLTNTKNYKQMYQMIYWASLVCLLVHVEWINPILYLSWGKKKKTKSKKLSLVYSFLYLLYNVYIILDILHNNGNNSYTLWDGNIPFDTLPIFSFKEASWYLINHSPFFLHLLKMADIKSHCLLYCFLL